MPARHKQTYWSPKHGLRAVQPGRHTWLYPPLGRSLFVYIALFALLGSAAKIFWLIVFGVDEEEISVSQGLG